MVNTILATDGKDSSSSTAGTSTGSYLVPRTLFGKLIKDVQKNLVFRGLARQIFGPKDIPGSSLDLPLATKDSMTINAVAEGAEIPNDVQSYSGITLTPVKYGVRIGITKELLQDTAGMGVMKMNIQEAAYELADNEDALIIATLSTGSGQTGGTAVANSNATLPVSDITAAMQGLEEEYHTPTDFIVGVEVANDLRNLDTFVEADKAGISNPGQSLIGTIFGMRVHVSHNVSAVLAYVIDRNHAFVIAEKQPVAIEQYWDHARETQYAVATQRVHCRYLRPGAIAKITTT